MSQDRGGGPAGAGADPGGTARQPIVLGYRDLSRLFRSDDIVRIYEKWFGDIGKPSAALLMMYAITPVPE